MSLPILESGAAAARFEIVDKFEIDPTGGAIVNFTKSQSNQTEVILEFMQILLKSGGNPPFSAKTKAGE